VSKPLPSAIVRRTSLPKSKETPQKAMVQMDMSESSSSTETTDSGSEEEEDHSDLSFMEDDLVSPPKPAKHLPVKIMSGRRGKPKSAASSAKPKTPTKPRSAVSKARNVFMASDSTESDGDYTFWVNHRICI
jgi:hypothetical protein